jgi:hypothetical protein
VMADDTDAFAKWGIPCIRRGAMTLVERQYAVECVNQIISNGCRVYGYDAFAVSEHGIQPFMEFSPDWSGLPTPSLDALIANIQADPEQVTHYEFVFEPS